MTEPLRRSIESILFLIIVLSFGFCRAQQKTSPYEVHTQISDDQKDSIFKVLHQHYSADLFVVPNIPKSKLKNAGKSCQITRSEQIYALINATVFGNAKNCLLLGSTGIYIHNDWACSHPGRYFISYSELKNSQISVGGKFEVNIGNASFDISGSFIKSRTLVSLLDDIKSKL